MKTIRHVRFSPDFRWARSTDGEEISFTRSEAKALTCIAAQAGTVVTRSQILDSLSEPGSEKNDRTVDFLINRIRRKLGDDARNPQYIGSRYGEGYVWLSDLPHLATDEAPTFYVVGPVRGLFPTEEVRTTILELADHLTSALQNHCRGDQHVVLDPDYSDEGYAGAARPRYLFEITTVSNRSNMGCVLTVKSTAAGTLIAAERIDLTHGDRLEERHCKEIDRLAPILLAKVWKSEATRGEDVPLPVAMNDVFNTEDEKDKTWRDADNRLRELLKDNPQDDETKLMYANHLHTKYVVLGPELFAKGEQNCEEDEREIERLVLDTLPFAQTRPDYSIMAAKLLYFLNSGYGSMATELAESAHDGSTKVAASLAVVGQLRSFNGRFDDAQECFEQARNLAKKGSDFHIYVLVLQCQMLLAANNRNALKKTQRELYRSRPATIVFFEPILTDPAKPSIRAQAVIMMLSTKRAQGLLQYLFYISGRLFEKVEHRENMMRAPLILLRRRFGDAVLTEEMRAALPGLTG